MRLMLMQHPCCMQVLPKVDIILLTHCTLTHLGALPYILSHHQTHAQVYATAPTHKMGLLVMMDQYHAKHAMQDFETFTPADISAAFARVRQLKYQQFVRLTGKCRPLGAAWLFVCAARSLAGICIHTYFSRLKHAFMDSYACSQSSCKLAHCCLLVYISASLFGSILKLC